MCYDDFSFYNIVTKIHTNTTVALKLNILCEFLVVMCCISLNFHFLQSLVNFKIFIIKKKKIFLYIWSQMLYAMLKLSKTTSPPELFPSDCITLYSSLAPSRSMNYSGSCGPTQICSVVNIRKSSQDRLKSRTAHFFQA